MSGQEMVDPVDASFSQHVAFQRDQAGWQSYPRPLSEDHQFQREIRFIWSRAEFGIWVWIEPKAFESGPT